MTILMKKQGKTVTAALVRKFVPTGEVRTPLLAVWSLLTEAADEAELLRPVGWKHLLRMFAGRRAFSSAVLGMA